MLFMPMNRESISIIQDRNKIIRRIHCDLKSVHVLIALFVICCVDKDFIVNLVETGSEGDFFFDNLFVLEDPH